MAQVKNKVRGEYTYPSDFTEIPDGGLVDSLNVNLDRDSIAEPRRGFNTYKAISASGSDRGKSLLTYRDTLIASYASALSRDGTDPFTTISGTFATPDHGGVYRPKLKGVEANRNFYFFCKAGIKKMTSATSTPTDSGMPRGLDLNLTLSGSSGFMADDSQVAYRIVWSQKDVNNNLILGAPSGRAVIANSTGGTRDVSLNFSIPAEITTADFYQIYRSAGSQTAAIEPNDELQLVVEDNPTSAEISAKQVTIVDSTPDDLRGATIYTAASQQGIAQSNDQPPTGKDICVFRNMVFISNTLQKHSIPITLLAAGGTSGISVNSITGNTTTTSTLVLNLSATSGLAAGQSVTGTGIPALTVISSVTPSFTLTGNTTNLSPIVTALSSTTNLKVGQNVTGTGIPALTKILTIDGPTQITLTANATATNVGTTLTFGAYMVLSLAATATGTAVALSVFDTIVIAGVTYQAAAAENVATPAFQVFTSGTPAQNIANTAQSLVKIINRYASNTLVYAYYDSGFEELPGQIFIQARALGGSSFTVQAFGHSDAWTPILTTAQTSSAEEKRNRLHVSKLQQYEAFPLTQYFDIGAADKEITRVIPLREVTIICKEDGFWRVVGDTPSTLQIEPVDLTTFLVAPETAQPLANQIYGFTTQGFSTINDTGVGVISRPIEDQINRLYAFSNLSTTAFAVSYETDRAYLCWVPEDNNDEYPSIVHRYNVFTQQWTKWEKPARGAIINPDDDKLYYLDATSNNVFKERKDRGYTDYTDEDIAVTITAVSGVTVTLSTLVTTISVGDAINQSTLPFSIITAVDNDGAATILTLNVERAYTLAAATVKKHYECRVEFAAQFCGNPGIMKQIREVQPLLKRAEYLEATLEFETDIKTGPEEEQITGFASFLWGYFGFGLVPWGGFNSISKKRALIPDQWQRCSWILTSFIVSQSYARFELAGMQYTFEPMSERTQGHE